jgi:integrase
MATRLRKTPSYRRHKPTGQAVVRLDGRDHYLGKFNTPESHERYHRLIAEWLTNGRRPPAADPGRAPADLTVNEVLLAFWHHAERHYRAPDGTPSGELANFRDAIRPLRRLYGESPAGAFGPLGLKAVRQAMIDSGLSRTTINQRARRIVQVFKWAVSAELVPPGVHQALRSVAGLQRGRSGARESGPIGPVLVEHVEAVLPLLPGPVAAMVRLQLLTGCRVGEVLTMRGCDLTSAGPSWEYRPASHKNAWRGQSRVIPLGPKAQAVVRGFLKPDPSAYLFSPRDVVGELHARRSGRRTTKRTPSEVARRRGAPGGGHGVCYDRRGYRQAIVRACRKAGVPAWSPLQLRHTTGTAIRAKYGLEAAQTVLGHVKPDTTLIYAERDTARAHAIAAEVG